MLLRFSQAFSVLSRPRLSAIFWDWNLPWRQLSLLTTWTAFKVCVISPQVSGGDQSDLQDVSLALLGLSYLTTDPDPDEALALLRLATLVSVTDSLRRVAASPEYAQSLGLLCSVCRLSVVVALGLSVINKVTAQQM